MTGEPGAGDDALRAKALEQVPVDRRAQVGRRRGQEDLIVARAVKGQHVGRSQRRRDRVSDGGRRLIALDGETDDGERHADLGGARALLLDPGLEVRVRPDAPVARRHARLLHHQDRRPDRHGFARQHRDARAVLERDVADLRAVDAADVLDLEHAGADVQPGVQARGERVADADVRVVCAADGQAAALGQRLGQEEVRAHDQKMKRSRWQRHRLVE